MALGMSLYDVVRCATTRPAEVLGRAGELGTLAEGTRADVTVLEVRREPWTFVDPCGNTLDSESRLVPHLVLRDGEPIVPSRRFLRDVCTPEERGEADLAIAVGGHPR
jgi:dihydroorotase